MEIKKLILLWSFFFLVCLGLGYPSVRRFDPRQSPGLSDTIKYYAMTTGEDESGFRYRFRCRVLVPYVARPFYLLIRARLQDPGAGFLALLISTAIFCATTCCLIVTLGNRAFADQLVGVLGATIYLLNFAIANLQLAGMIDAGETCLMAALIWSLLSNRWYLLPLWGIVGALAKETYVPFAFVFTLTWWWFETAERRVRRARLKYILLLAVLGLVTVALTHFLITKQFIWPWQIANDERAAANLLGSAWRITRSKELWYLFVWLLPLGVVRLKDFPRAWVRATAATVIVALALGVFNDAKGNVARAFFDVAGPLLSLSVAAFFARFLTYKSLKASA